MIGHPFEDLRDSGFISTIRDAKLHYGICIDMISSYSGDETLLILRSDDGSGNSIAVYRSIGYFCGFEIDNAFAIDGVDVSNFPKEIKTISCLRHAVVVSRDVYDSHKQIFKSRTEKVDKEYEGNLESV